jgi:hypothetical protein
MSCREFASGRIARVLVGVEFTGAGLDFPWQPSILDNYTRTLENEAVK